MRTTRGRRPTWLRVGGGSPGATGESRSRSVKLRMGAPRQAWAGTPIIAASGACRAWRKRRQRLSGGPGCVEPTGPSADGPRPSRSGRSSPRPASPSTALPTQPSEHEARIMRSRRRSPRQPPTTMPPGVTKVRCVRASSAQSASRRSIRRRSRAPIHLVCHAPVPRSRRARSRGLRDQRHGVCYRARIQLLAAHSNHACS